MNDFDFFTLSAVSSSVKSLMKVGKFTRDDVVRSIDWTGKFPKHSYRATVGSIGVMGIGHIEARLRIEELKAMLPVIDGVSYYINFYTVD